VFTAEGELVREEVCQDEDRGGDAGASELGTFFGGRNGQRVGAGLKNGAGDGDGAVTIGVGLHHRHETGVRSAAQEGTDVVPDGTEIHFGPGATWYLILG
jgi:hypothetical protein